MLTSRDRDVGFTSRDETETRPRRDVCSYQDVNVQVLMVDLYCLLQLFLDDARIKNFTSCFKGTSCIFGYRYMTLQLPETASVWEQFNHIMSHHKFMLASVTSLGGGGERADCPG